MDDLYEEAADIDDAIDALLSAVGIRRNDADLVLDLEAVSDESDTLAKARVISDAVRDLTDIEKWRTLITVSGAFPIDLSGVPAWTIGEPPRHDAVLFDRVRQRRQMPRVPTYGDYAIAHPKLPTGPAFPPAPSLRYTVSDRWLTLRGRRNDPAGHNQFYEICEMIATHADFAGADLGLADKRIRDSRHYGPGNASTWREIGTTHHLDYVVQRITNLGEP
jgi:hypothetical protein